MRSGASALPCGVNPHRLCCLEFHGRDRHGERGGRHQHSFGGLFCINRGAPSAALLLSPWEKLRFWDSCQATPDTRQCKSATTLPRAALRAHTWHFLHLRPFCLGCRGSTRRTPRTLTSLLFRFAPDHDVCRDLLRRSHTHPLCIGLGTHTSDQSRLVSVSGCVLEHTQATMYRDARQHFRNLPVLT